jgi:hypothetical protein
MSATYSKTSLYSGTGLWGTFLDLWAGKTINPDPSDALYQIDTLYNRRPDLLAYDLYGDANLWWVFTLRNPDILKDPLFDFVSPRVIYLPNKEVVRISLGL